MFNFKLLTRLQQLFLATRLPHAMLFTGKADQSVALAQHFSQWLLCLHKSIDDPTSCKCASCNLFVAKNHPDFRLLDFGIDQEIKIDNIRAANEFATTKAYLADRKILLINHTHNLNLQAANALLKTLEDPSGYTVEVIFCLISNNYKILPATILSRVVKINTNFELNYEKVNTTGLDLAQLEITQELYDYWVLAKQNINDVISRWQKIPQQQLIDCLWFVMVKLLKDEQHQLLIGLKKKISPQVIWLLLDSLNYINKLIILGVHINWQLFLYNFLLTSITGENIYASRARA